MRCGLFGKLPAKRDFIAEGMPAPFLAMFEPWLQGAMSASRLALGAQWQKAYYRAPIWRFWLGADYCGAAVVGVLMPSVDGVGRTFPLVLAVTADDGAAFPHPATDPQGDWFAAAEHLLLSALDEGRTFEDVQAALHALPLPATVPAPVLPADAVVLPDGTLAQAGGNGDVATLFRAAMASDAAVWRHGSYWWTIGGEDIAPQLLAGLKLPDPQLFTGLMTGRFDLLRARAD